MWIATGAIPAEFKNMICIKCDNEVFAEKPNAIIEQEFRGEVLQVKMTAAACTKCGWQTLSLGQTDELRRRTADTYREKHGLLTSSMIKLIRKMKDMSQIEFAAFLGVCVASVKRWETWQVQEPLYDQLIRRKCAIELNTVELRDNWQAALSGTEWTSVLISLLPIAAFSSFIPKPQPINPRFVPSPKAAQPSFLWSRSDEKDIYSKSGHEELALAA